MATAGGGNPKKEERQLLFEINTPGVIRVRNLTAIKSPSELSAALQQLGTSTEHTETSLQPKQSSQLVQSIRVKAETPIDASQQQPSPIPHAPEAKAPTVVFKKVEPLNSELLETHLKKNKISCLYLTPEYVEGWGDEDYHRVFAAVAQCTSLVKIHLDGIILSPVVKRADGDHKDQPTTRLENLKAAIKNSKKISTIDILNSDIDDKMGVGLIKAMQVYLTELADLSLFNNKLGDNSATQIKALLSDPKLSLLSLDVQNNPKISLTGLENILLGVKKAEQNISRKKPVIQQSGEHTVRIGMQDPQFRRLAIGDRIVKPHLQPEPLPCKSIDEKVVNMLERELKSHPLQIAELDLGDIDFAKQGLCQKMIDFARSESANNIFFVYVDRQNVKSQSRLDAPFHTDRTLRTKFGRSLKDILRVTQPPPSQRTCCYFGPSLYAAVYGNTQAAKELLAFQKQTRQTEFEINPEGAEMSPLAHAITGHHHEIAQLVLEEGADINGIKNNHQPIIRAALFNNIPALRYLLTRGATFATVKVDGEPLLHYITSLGNIEAVKLLVKAGADRTEKDAAGKTALDRAKEYGHPELYKILDPSSRVTYSSKEEDLRSLTSPQNGAQQAPDAHGADEQKATTKPNKKKRKAKPRADKAATPEQSSHDSSRLDALEQSNIKALQQLAGLSHQIEKLAAEKLALLATNQTLQAAQAENAETKQQMDEKAAKLQQGLNRQTQETDELRGQLVHQTTLTKQAEQAKDRESQTREQAEKAARQADEKTAEKQKQLTQAQRTAADLRKQNVDLAAQLTTEKRKTQQLETQQSQNKQAQLQAEEKANALQLQLKQVQTDASAKEKTIDSQATQLLQLREQLAKEREESKQAIAELGRKLEQAQQTAKALEQKKSADETPSLTQPASPPSVQDELALLKAAVLKLQSESKTTGNANQNQQTLGGSNNDLLTEVQSYIAQSKVAKFPLGFMQAQGQEEGMFYVIDSNTQYHLFSQHPQTLQYYALLFNLKNKQWSWVNTSNPPIIASESDILAYMCMYQPQQTTQPLVQQAQGSVSVQQQLLLQTYSSGLAINAGMTTAAPPARYIPQRDQPATPTHFAHPAGMHRREAAPLIDQHPNQQQPQQSLPPGVLSVRVVPAQQRSAGSPQNPTPG